MQRIDSRNALGLVDKVMGLGKEIAGTLLGRDRLTKAGQVQQQKGAERIEALRSEAAADRHEDRASAAAQAQRRAQTTKEEVKR